jgi:type IV secretory pathway VirB2 component (pilin)
MKKILILFTFSFAFLLFSFGSEAQAQAVCGGTPGQCISALQGTSCTGRPGCTSANGVCSGTPTTISCASIQTAQLCVAAGCSAIVLGDANNNAFVDTLCNALKIVTGSGGKAFAAFAIISCGIGFFTGKISWGLMIGITCGIAAMFGAPTIVSAITGGDALDCQA